jgi:type II secretory pathway predicted ATPase ExeA
LCEVNDPQNKQKKPSLADDSSSAARVNDLNRGLADDDWSIETAAPSPASISQASTPLRPPAARPVSTRPAQPRTAPAPMPGLMSGADHRSSVEDPSIAAGLNDLERGLDLIGDTRPPFARATSTGPAAAKPISPPALPPLVAAPDGPVRTRRPLLELFPPALLEPERSPESIVGTAPAPQLPSVRSARHPPPQRTHPLTYETFYGLHETPFSLLTDPKFLYRSASHDRVATQLLEAIRRRDGIMLLTGEPGLGKTTLCRAIIQDLDRRTVTSLWLEPLLSVDDLLKTMLVDFGVVAREDLARAAVSREALTTALRSFLESLVPLQASAVVFIDDAHDLPVAVIEDIRAVTAAGQDSKLLQVVLVGRPRLMALLKRQELQALNQRVALRCELGPLEADEITGYVMHRLAVAGVSPRVEFDDAASARIYELSHGVPSVVNLLSDRALSRGREMSASVIDDELIEAAAEDLELGRAGAEPVGILRALFTVLAFIALILLGAGGALWAFRVEVARTVNQWEGVPPVPGGPIRELPVPLTPLPPPADDDPSTEPA